jgi:hypothetical protein
MCSHLLGVKKAVFNFLLLQLSQLLFVEVAVVIEVQGIEPARFVHFFLVKLLMVIETGGDSEQRIHHFFPVPIVVGVARRNATAGCRGRIK